MKVRLLFIILLAFLLSVFADFFLFGGGGEGHFWWSRFYGFFALFGFLGCLAIILFSKVLGGLWLQRTEDYYEREGNDE
jgi:hypothetical protein